MPQTPAPSTPSSAPSRTPASAPASAEPPATPTDHPSDDLLVTGPLLTPEEVADMLRISTRTLADWRLPGRGPEDTPLPLRVGSRVAYSLDDVNAYLSRQVQAARARRKSDT